MYQITPSLPDQQYSDFWPFRTKKQKANIEASHAAATASAAAADASRAAATLAAQQAAKEAALTEKALADSLASKATAQQQIAVAQKAITDTKKIWGLNPVLFFGLIITVIVVAVTVLYFKFIKK